MRALIAGNPPPLLISSRLLIVEIASALARRLREKTITRSIFLESRAAFDDDSKFEYQLIDATLEIVTDARDLVCKHPLRSYDAIHLASALKIARFFRQANLPAPVFLSADDRLIQVARAEKLKAENPNSHSQ